MPKIRGVKPDYWTDEDIVDLSIPARLLFIGMWNFACDNGHLQDKPKQIKMRIFPGDDVNATKLIAELEASGRITRGDGWITIPNLTEHQKPDIRYFTTCDKDGCDDPPEKVSQRNSRRAHGVHTKSARSEPGVSTAGARADGEGDGEREGEGEVIVSSAPADAEAKKPSRATRRPADFHPSAAHVALANERGVDLRNEWAKFCDYCDANGKTYKDWDAGLRNWIRNARPTAQTGSQPTRAQQHLALARQLAEEERDQVIPFRQIGDGR